MGKWPDGGRREEWMWNEKKMLTGYVRVVWIGEKKRLERDHRSRSVVDEISP